MQIYISFVKDWFIVIVLWPAVINTSLRIVLSSAGISIQYWSLLQSNNKKDTLGAAAYQLGNTSSRTITEVKQRLAWLVLGWENVPSVAWVLLPILKVG